MKLGRVACCPLPAWEVWFWWLWQRCLVDEPQWR
jgi:hypothetical protein